MIRVEARGIVARSGESVLLDQVDLAFEAPALIGILGPNGSGKSTLLRLLAGYRAPEEGEILWTGRPLRSWTPIERASACGYCPQQFQPAWDYSVEEIIRLGRERNLSHATASDTVLRENELEALADRRWSRLSGGERARTMLAATLATRPTLVLADEPGASLDMRHRLALMRRLHAYSRQGLVIVVMHDLDLALRFCDRLILLDRGRIAADRRAGTMLNDPALAAAFGLRLQIEPRRPDHDWVIGLG